MENYERLKAQSPSPGRMATIALAALIVYTAVAGIATDNRALAVGATPAGDAPYAIKITAVRDGDTVELQGRVTDNQSGKVLAEPKVTIEAGGEATARAASMTDQVEVTFHVRPATGPSFAVEVTVDKAGNALFQRTLMVTPSKAGLPRKYNGAPVSLELVDADIKDVLRTFGHISGLKVEMDESIDARITVSWVDVPWDQALDEVLRENDLTWRLEGSTLYVEKR